MIEIEMQANNSKIFDKKSKSKRSMYSRAGKTVKDKTNTD